MEYGSTIELLLVTTLLLLGHAKSQYVPDSPCPNIFKYERDSSGRWYGSISAPNPYPYVALKITVAMYITDRVPPGSNAKLELVNKNAWQVLAAGNRNPVQYRLDFPMAAPMPLIKDITINENVVCKGNKPNSQILTTLLIQHEIFNEKCSSSNLQCPFNNINQLGGTVGGSIGGGGGGGGGWDGGGEGPIIDNSPSPPMTETGYPQMQMSPATGYVCNDIFSYQQDNFGEWYGLIRIPNPYPVVAINLKVEIYITNFVSQGNSGDLRLVNDLKSEWRRMRTGEQYSVPYRLTFPRQFPMPTLKIITANGVVLCRGSRPGQPPLIPQTTKPPPWTPKPPQQKPNPPPPTPKPPQPTPRPPPVTPPIEEIPSPPRIPNPQPSGPQCGNPAVKTNALAFHGKETKKGQWPWHAAIFHYNGFNTRYVCGGSFIGTRSILTAAHCVTNNGQAMEPNQLIIYLGRYNLTDRQEIRDAQDIEVNYVLVHPSFNHSKLQADVAILILQSTVKVNDRVKPVCLWNFQEVSLTDIVGENGFVVGWGLDENGNTAEELKMVTMPIVDSQMCIWSNPTFFSQFTSNTTFCAGFRNGTSVCNGDSGGGLVLPRTQSDGTIIWMLRGIVSNSKQRENAGKICDTKNYIIFMDVAKFLNWINAVFI